LIAPAPAPPPRRRPAALLTRALGWRPSRLRPSRFELKISLALVLSGVVPLVAALWLAGRLADENLAFALNPRVLARLESTPTLFRDLFQARKQLYAEQARSVARGLPAKAEELKAYLGQAVRRTPRLRRAAVLDQEGAELAAVEATEPNPDGEWRAAPARVALRGGAVLECTFAIEARFFADLDEARELAEFYQSAGALRGDIRRSYLRAFGYLLAVWAMLAGLSGFWLARRTTRRVSGLIQAVRELAHGNLEVQVDPGAAADEVAGLARAFNSMVREVRESRDRIVYLEKISGWQEVARRLAHEIKNPLTPIQLAFQQFQVRFRAAPNRDPELEKLLGEVGEIVGEEIGTLQRLVEDFSSFAKLPEVRPEPCELGAFVEEFVRTSPQLSEGADIEITHGLSDCPVALDRTLMRRVLSNLLKNAVEAVRPARARVHIGIARFNDLGVITIADEGPGVEPALRSRIFDPYFTTKGDGTGLGLAIVKKIVLQHGGEIATGERPGGGALFTISFPVVVVGKVEASSETAAR
jgi:nitrogen fixation/metabolism regulation signal transduction histidine kinase